MSKYSHISWLQKKTQIHQRLLVCLVLLCSSMFGFSQTKIDSIQEQLSQFSSPDSNRILLLIELAEWYEDEEVLDESMKTFQLAINEAKGLRSPRFLARTYYELGHYWRHRDNLEEGLKAYVIAAEFYEASEQNAKLAKLNKQIESHQAALQARNEQLMRVNDDKNDLVSIVAHDLRAPLGNIQGLVKHMQKDKAHSKDQVQYLEMIDRSCSRLIEMTNAVLDMEAIEAEHLNVTLQKLDVVRLVKNLVSEAKNTASEKQITLKSNLSDKDMNIIADQNFLQPVIQNLVTNAINYSPTHTSINLNVASNGFKTIIEVSDKGPGISASDQKRLFSPFQTLSNKPTQNENSTGLGLYITKRYVEAMNGLIRCNSKVGEGTTFEVEFESA